MPKDTDKKEPGPHGHKGHLWMMAICCGLPIVGFLAIAGLGVSLPSLETLFLLLCPIGMAGMMYFMHRDGCAHGRQDEADVPARSDEVAGNDPVASNAALEKGDATTKKGYLEA